jgi:glycosyltransferase involved in cell wall biosynthesis
MLQATERVPRAEPPSTAQQDGAPRITVATVVRNAVATIEATILSVASQTYAEIEYIVIDGRSTDGTLDIIERHASHITAWISEPDTGIYDAMNKALRLARGRWLLFLGGDDVLTDPDILARVVSRLRDEQVVYYANVVLKSTGRPYCGPMNTYKLMQQNICHQAVFYPASVFKTKPYDVGAGLLADYKYNLELWGSGISFRHLPLSISFYEDAGASSRPDDIFESMRLALIEQNLGRQWAWIKRIRNMAVRLLKRGA